jgi:hypothetical protein
MADSRGLIDKSSLKCSHMPALEQLMKLQTLGLSEQEAVEYTLMLSRDEELLRLQDSTGEHLNDGIFDIDENSRNQASSHQPSPPSLPLLQYSPPPLRTLISGSGTTSHGELVPSVSPSKSNVKVQVSPRFIPEPMQAGGLPDSAPDSQSMIVRKTAPSSPPLPFSPSTLGSTPRVVTPPKQGHGVGTSGKPNAWSKPLPGTGSSASPPTQIRRPLPPSSLTHWEVEAERIRQVEDPELRLALEVSLAEAQSRERDAGAT